MFALRNFPGNTTSTLLLPLTLMLLLGVTTNFAQSRSSRDNDDEQGVVATTVQLPTLGISIDANGILTAKAFPDPHGELIRKRVAQAKLKLPGDLGKKSALRKISLRQLEAAIHRLAEQGKPPTDTMQNLAGLTQARFVFAFPKDGDIIIAGPAEPWVQNPSGRTVGIFSNQPTLRLDDLVAALRTFRPTTRLDKWVAVSIDPTAKGIENLKAFQKTIPKNIPPAAKARAAVEIGDGLRQSLGQAEIKVYGMPRKTHLVQVMIEADYRMKLMAVGLEPPPIKITTFIGALRGAPRDMQRWWLSPNYQCVKVTEDQLAIELVGRKVILSTQRIDYDRKAKIVAKKKKSSPASTRYAKSFTENYESLSRVRPVYAELRNVVDLLVLAAWIHKSKNYQRCGWSPKFLLDEMSFPIETFADPKKCPCVANAVWKRNVLILPAGGGVSITASRALEKNNLLDDKEGKLKKARDEFKLEPDRWWWD